MSRRIRVWAYVTASLVVLAWPFVWDFAFQGRLGRWFQTRTGAAQQAAEVFAMFSGGSLRSYSLARDWPFHAACVVFAARALWLLRRDRHVPGHCPCGYDLTGNVSGTCPECGVEAKL